MYYPEQELRVSFWVEILESMKILTVCEQGLNRSVAAKWQLQFHPNEVIAAGLHNLSASSFAMLVAWADRVILLDGRYRNSIDVPADKLLVWDVGPDTYAQRHFDPSLLAKLRHHGATTHWPTP